MRPASRPPAARAPARGAGLARRLVAWLVLALGTAPAQAQQRALPGAEERTLEVVADTTRVTVGQPITLRVRGRLGPGDSLAARTVVPLGRAPEAMRILSQDSLVAATDGSVSGALRVAFFRPGQRAVPALGVPYTPEGGAAGQRLVSAPLPIEVARVLPPGEQELRDIKDLVPLEAGGPPLWLLAAALALAALAAWLLWRRLRRRPDRAAVGTPVAARRDPYEAALAELAEIEAAGWPERGEVLRHYAATADVLRRYLEDAESVPALELTTSELAWALPPALSADGRREGALVALGEADLVKFARVRPGPEAARRFTGGARALLEGWHEAAVKAREAALAAALAATAPEGGATEAAGAPPPEGSGTAPPGVALDEGTGAWAPPEPEAWRGQAGAAEEGEEDPGALR